MSFHRLEGFLLQPGNVTLKFAEWDKNSLAGFLLPVLAGMTMVPGLLWAVSPDARAPTMLRACCFVDAVIGFLGSRDANVASHSSMLHRPGSQQSLSQTSVMVSVRAS